MCDIFLFYVQQQRYIWIPYDTFRIHNWTWESHLNKLGETSTSLVNLGTIVHTTQEDLNIWLERNIELQINMGSDEFLVN